MQTVRAGEKRDIRVGVAWAPGAGSGVITVTSPQRRIRDASKTLITGYDWAGATWDATLQEIYTLFDSTATGLTAVGTYYVDFRGTIGLELYERSVTVQVVAL